MIPMAMGWAQPSTAAITVMLIATSGVVGESVMKGLIRIVGTIIGAIIGMGLIALFPQERMSYLLVVSIVVPLILYLYHAYQGDSTVFMLSALMILMVFKGGEVDDIFLYGVDRTYMTLFGIIIYTIIGIFLWPVKVEDSTMEDAKTLSAFNLEFFNKTVLDKGSDDALLVQMKTALSALNTSYVKAGSGSVEMNINSKKWDDIMRKYQRLTATLESIDAHVYEKSSLEYQRYIAEYAKHLQSISELFNAVSDAWIEPTTQYIEKPKKLEYRISSMTNIGHLERSNVIAHAQNLNQLQDELYALLESVNALYTEVPLENNTRTTPTFVFLDPEYIKGTAQTFLIFWFSTALWIYLNPPGGFMLVTLATVLSVLTSFSPLKPSMLIKIFTIGFIFALLMYVFVLPNLVYAWQLALFLFTYTFIAFHLLNPKISVFFLLGLFTLGIGNTMHYHFDIFLITLLVFYLFLFILMLFYYIPFSTKPEHLVLLMKKRAFKHISALLSSEKRAEDYHQFHLERSVSKLQLWALKVDGRYFKKSSVQELADFSAALLLLSSKIKLFNRHNAHFKKSVLYLKIRELSEGKLFEKLGETFLEDKSVLERETTFNEIRAQIHNIESTLEKLKAGINIESISHEDIGDFYINIDLRHSLWMALEKTNRLMNTIDFEDLKMSRL